MVKYWRFFENKFLQIGHFKYFTIIDFRERSIFLFFFIFSFFFLKKRIKCVRMEKKYLGKNNCWNRTWNYQFEIISTYQIYITTLHRIHWKCFHLYLRIPIPQAYYDQLPPKNHLLLGINIMNKSKFVVPFNPFLTASKIVETFQPFK